MWLSKSELQVYLITKAPFFADAICLPLERDRAALASGEGWLLSSKCSLQPTSFPTERARS